MKEPGGGETRLTEIAGLTGAAAGVALMTLVVVSPLVIPIQFEPIADVLKSLPDSPSQGTFAFLHWGFTLGALLAIPLLLGLHRLLRISQPAYSLLGVILGVVSSVMSALASTVYAATIPSLAESYASTLDQDIQRSVEFQATAFNALATGINSVAIIVLATSLAAWSVSMSNSDQLKRFNLMTALIAIFALVTILPFGPARTLLRLGLLLLQGAWFGLVGVKVAIAGRQAGQARKRES